MTLDVEGVLAAERCRAAHGWRWRGPGRVTTPCAVCTDETAHVAAVLRDQIAAAIEEARFVGKADAMERVLDPKGPIWNRMHAEGWDEGHRFTGYEPEPGENPYWTALAAQVAVTTSEKSSDLATRNPKDESQHQSRVPGEGS